MRWYKKSILLLWKAEDEGRPKPALRIPSPDLFIPLLFPALYISHPVKRFPNKVAPNVPNNKLRNPPFCSFT